jgi:hypothetical protein
VRLITNIQKLGQGDLAGVEFYGESLWTLLLRNLAMGAKEFVQSRLIVKIYLFVSSLHDALRSPVNTMLQKSYFATISESSSRHFLYKSSLWLPLFVGIYAEMIQIDISSDLYCQKNTQGIVPFTTLTAIVYLKLTIFYLLDIVIL